MATPSAGSLSGKRWQGAARYRQALLRCPPLGFDPRNKYLELKELRDRIRRKLGPQDDLGRILQETVDQYMVVIEMLRQRGQPDFQRYSQLLYGSASDHLRGDRKTLKELGARLCDIFSLPGARHLVRPYPKELKERPRSPNCRASCRATSVTALCR